MRNIIPITLVSLLTVASVSGYNNIPNNNVPVMSSSMRALDSLSRKVASEMPKDGRCVEYNKEQVVEFFRANSMFSSFLLG